MARRIEFFFDCSSPWTYLAFHAVQPLAAELGAEIAWKPILVGGVFNTVNQTVYESRSKPNPLKASYMLKDLADWARLYGLKIVFPPDRLPGEQREVHARRVRGARRGQAGALRDGRVRGLLERRPRHLEGGRARRHRRQGRARASTLLRRHRDPTSCKARLRANTDELIERGGFGSPTMFVDGSMFFGNDRLPLVRAALEAA